MNKPFDWWKGGIIYQIYPRSFYDSNGDGIGDLPGVMAKLEYVASLGVDGVWLSPFFTSPMKDFGYDVSDYRGVDPMFGSLEDFKRLVSKAHYLNLKVLIDQVSSHTSDEHPWFKESSSSRDNSKSDWYVWADPKPDGNPPNNWLSIFTGSAWQYHQERQQYYLHNFLVSQPDLNFHNEEVRKASLENMQFWLELGVDGFRLDTVNFYYHDPELRDNPPITSLDKKNPALPATNPYTWQQHTYDLSRPENIEFISDIRKLLDEYPGSTLVGEITDDNPLQRMAEYTQGQNRLHMAYTFDLLTEHCDTAYIRSVIRQFNTIAPDAWPCWALSNHDVTRSASRWGKGEDAEAYPLIIIVMIMSLRGSVCLYQGEELGLTEAEVPFEKLQDPYGISYWPEYKGRDGCRTPMVWDSSSCGGFSEVEPWLSIDIRHLSKSVQAQNKSPDSMLNKLRRFIKWRNQHPVLLKGELHLLEGNDDALCWIRKYGDESILVAINLTSESITIDWTGDVLRALKGHGLGGKLQDSEIVIPAYQGFFAEIIF